MSQSVAYKPQMMVQETILLGENLDMCDCCRSKSNALTSDGMTNWFKDFGPHAAIRGAKPKLDTEMSSCVGCCGLNKWHLEAQSGGIFRRGGIIGRMTFGAAPVYMHRRGFGAERRVITSGPVEAFFQDRNYSCLWISTLVSFISRS